jgi:YesN/AraC family two-component response regulator
MFGFNPLQMETRVDWAPGAGKKAPEAEGTTWDRGSGVESPVKILVVDDDEICREILKDSIGQWGVEVGLASDGLEGLEKLAAEPFDILITDINMPRMDGLTLLREAKQRYPHILTIIITGYGSLESAIEAIRQGTYDYMQKPFKIEELAVTTRNAIEKVKMLRDRQRMLEELESVHRRLYELEEEQRLMKAANNHDSADRTVAAVNAYGMFPRRSLPLSAFERSSEEPNHVLTELERLKDLRTKGIINEKEFEGLKRAILDRLATTKLGAA